MLKIISLMVLLLSNAHAIRNGAFVSHSSRPDLIRLELGESICSGVRISAQYALTAAHCFKRNPTSFRVVYIHPVTRKIFSKKVYRSDVIIKSSELDQELAVFPLEVGDLVDSQPLAHYQRGLFFGEKDFEIIGFGMNQKGITGKLRLGKMQYSSDYRPAKNTYNMLSLKSTHSNQIACPGDSGGPLFINEDNQRKLVGIVSFISSTTNAMGKKDPEITQCKKADRAFYIPLGEHLEFLSPYL